jgi:NTP pyrophosphatase (non-canonical NTP hydrolase)
MSLNVYKHETITLCRTRGWTGPNIEQVWMYFTEEVGELAGSIRRHKNQFRDKKKIKIEAEMGDVFSYLFQLAHMLNIDLDEMWVNNKKKMMKKTYYSNNNYNNNTCSNNMKL